MGLGEEAAEPLGGVYVSGGLCSGLTLLPQGRCLGGSSVSLIGPALLPLCPGPTEGKLRPIVSSGSWA